MYAYNSESLNLFIFGYSNDTWPSHKEFETSTRTEICFNFHNTTVRTVRRLIFFCYIISRYVNDNRVFYLYLIISVFLFLFLNVRMVNGWPFDAFWTSLLCQWLSVIEKLLFFAGNVTSMVSLSRYWFGFPYCHVWVVLCSSLFICRQCPSMQHQFKQHNKFLELWDKKWVTFLVGTEKSLFFIIHRYMTSVSSWHQIVTNKTIYKKDINFKSICLYETGIPKGNKVVLFMRINTPKKSNKPLM